jgi:hypothetical protein
MSIEKDSIKMSNSQLHQIQNTKSKLNQPIENNKIQLNKEIPETDSKIYNSIKNIFLINTNIFELVDLQYFENNELDYLFHPDIPIPIINYIFEHYGSHVPRYNRFILNEASYTNLITDKKTDYISIIDASNEKESTLYINNHTYELLNVFNDYIQLLEYICNEN